MIKLTDIKGIGETHAQKLKGCGVASQAQLLAKGGTPAGRRNLTEKSGISDELILKWINRADIARIRGVDDEYAELLERTGVDTVLELTTRNAISLHAKMAQINEEKNLVRALPSESQVMYWVAQAKDLDRAIHY